MLREKGFFRGINLGGWLSQCDYSEDRLNNFIKEEDIAKIASWELDHVRIPVDYNVLEEEAGVYKESGFAHIDREINNISILSHSAFLKMKSCRSGFTFYGKRFPAITANIPIILHLNF